MDDSSISSSFNTSSHRNLKQNSESVTFPAFTELPWQYRTRNEIWEQYIDLNR